MPRYIPIPRGQMQFPKNTNPTDLQKGDMWLDETTGKPMGFFGNMTDANDTGTITPIGGGATLSGHIIKVDKDCADSTDTRGTLSNYDQTKPFKTIQAAFNVAQNKDTVYVCTASTAYAENVIIPSVTGVQGLVLIMDGAVLNGGTDCALKPLNANNLWYLWIRVINNGSIVSTGNAADRLNTATIVTHGVILSIVGDTPNKITDNYSIKNTNAACISCGLSSSARIAISNISLNSGYRIFDKVGVDATNCFFNSTSELLNTNPNDKFYIKYCNINCIALNFTCQRISFTDCDISSSIGLVIVRDSGIITFCKNRIQCGTNAFSFTGSAANSTIDICFNQIGIYTISSETIFVTGGSGKINCVNNILNKAPNITSLTPTTTVATTNIVITDASGSFPYLSP